MKRRLFAIVAAGSLLPCVAACVLWARSYAVEDVVVWQGSGAAWSAASAQGWVVVEWNRSNWSGLPAEREIQLPPRDDRNIEKTVAKEEEDERRGREIRLSARGRHAGDSATDHEGTTEDRK